MNKFLTAQRSCLAPDVWNAVADAQAGALAQRMVAARLSAEEATGLAETIAHGPWSEANRGRLGEALSHALAGTGSKGRRPNQVLSAGFSAFLSPKDKEVMASDEHPFVKVRTLVSRCCALGLHLPSEKAIGQVVAAGLEAGLQATHATDRLGLIHQFKLQLRKACKLSPGLEKFIQEFPSSPHALPQEVLQKAYSEGDLPPRQSSDLATPPAQCVPLRKTNRLVRSDSAVGGGGNSMEAATCQAMMGHVFQMFQACVNGGSASGLVPGLQVFSDKRRQKAVSNAASLSDTPSTQKAVSDAASLSDTHSTDKADSQGSSGSAQFSLMDSAYNARSEQQKTGKAAEQEEKASEGVGAATTFYRQGKIHRSDATESWRVFVHKSDRCDKKIRWHGDEEGAWKKALHMIDGAA
ncbi:unnamed protein product [Effrenium voratum]|nr:unnamed protein product [Effrenium voratum]